MHIVVFPGWYPNRMDKFSGDFIQRHMHAIAQNCRVSVIIPIKDVSVKKTEIIKSTQANLTEIYFYYPSLSSIKWIDGLLSFIRYNYLCFTTAASLSANERIDLTHIYVLQKNHLTGLLLKWRYKIPFVVSEQSTLYVDGRFERLSRLQKQIWYYAFNKASSFHAVSKYLLSAIVKKLQLNRTGVVIPNVVDTDLFFYKQPAVNNRVSFIHVSNMVYQKNIDGMLRAFAAVKTTNDNFILNLVGPASGGIISLIADLTLEKHVVVWNERPYKEVAAIMQQSDVFVFFTRFETFGCVIIEANACGLPVIVTDLEVTKEIIEENVNGLFVENENVQELTSKILFLINNQSRFDRAAIAAHTREKYNYKRIGDEFMNWYAEVLSKG